MGCLCCALLPSYCNIINSVSNAKRRLDLSSSARTTGANTKVKNPYLKASKPASKPTSKPESEYQHTTKEDVKATTVITPDAGIEKFFVSSRKDGGKKSAASRKLVTPHENNALKLGHGQKRKSLDFASDDDTSDFYYHSDEEARTTTATKKGKVYKPGHMHSSLDYHHRGDLPLDQGKLKAYRFIRNHFLIPRDIEADPKFGTYSGSCFEERVIRAYTLGQLKPKKSKLSASSLVVCSYCGEEGHARDDCPELV